MPRKMCVFFVLSTFYGAATYGQVPSLAPNKVDLSAVSVPNVEREEFDRFLAASMVFSLPEHSKIVAYEMVTRCSIEIPVSIDGSALGAPLLHSMGRDYVSAVAPSISANTAIEITTMLAGQSEAQQDRCTNRIRGYFGSQYQIDASELRPLAQRAIQVLRGSPLDQGINQITDLTARTATEMARLRVDKDIKALLFMGAVRTPGHVAIILGEPGAVVRWVVQFAEIPSGYQLEGAMEAGLSDDSK